MTREEAIAEIERLLECAKKLEGPQTFVEFRPVPALEMALAALRPVSREQAEKVWRGEWEYDHETIIDRFSIVRCSECGHEAFEKARYVTKGRFCPACGAPMTDEAVEMVMRRLEALHGET